MGILALAVLFLALMTAASLIIPVFLKQGFELAASLREKEDKNKQWELKKIFMIVGSLLAVGPVLNSLKTGLTGLAGERFLRRLRDIVFAILLDQPVSFFDASMSGELVNRIASDTQVMQKLVSYALPQLCNASMGMIASFVIMFVTDWRLSLVFWGGFPLITGFATCSSIAIKKQRKKYQSLLADAGALISETVSQIRTVRAFAADSRTQREFQKLIQAAYVVGLKLIRIRIIFDFLVFAVFQGCYAAFFVLGCYMVIWGDINLPTILQMLIYVVLVIGSSIELVMAIEQVADSAGAASRIFEIINTRDQALRKKEELTKLLNRESPADQHRKEEFDGSVVFDAVVFGYKEDNPILKGVSFEVQEGRTVALVGASGGGKSTIVSIIERYYEAQKGQVFVGGKDVRNINLVWMRRNLVSIVAQEPSLFSGTVRTNIAYGYPDAPDHLVISSAKLANAHEFILKLENGYDTMVGERGVTLSGGQKQRVAIARALIMDAKILLLDEATSALDAESEHLVQEALNRVIRDARKTVIVIAHRLSTVRGADVILVVRGGEIVERGDHAELMTKQGGAYRALVEGQLKLG